MIAHCDGRYWIRSDQLVYLVHDIELLSCSLLNFGLL